MDIKCIKSKRRRRRRKKNTCKGCASRSQRSTSLEASLWLLTKPFIWLIKAKGNTKINTKSLPRVKSNWSKISTPVLYIKQQISSNQLWSRQAAASCWADKLVETCQTAPVRFKKGLQDKKKYAHLQLISALTDSCHITPRTKKNKVCANLQVSSVT